MHKKVAKISEPLGFFLFLLEQYNFPFWFLLLGKALFLNLIQIFRLTLSVLFVSNYISIFPHWFSHFTWNTFCKICIRICFLINEVLLRKTKLILRCTGPRPRLPSKYKMKISQTKKHLFNVFKIAIGLLAHFTFFFDSKINKLSVY